jgi:hypothetical protein
MLEPSSCGHLNQLLNLITLFRTTRRYLLPAEERDGAQGILAQNNDPEYIRAFGGDFQVTGNTQACSKLNDNTGTKADKIPNEGHLMGEQT